MKILIIGLPGNGKTALASTLAVQLGAVLWDADDVRDNINSHLGFTNADRLQQARTMGFLCNRVDRAGMDAVCSFVCPTEEARQAFGSPDVVVWMNNIQVGRFEDTNRIFIPPKNPDIVIDYFDIKPLERETQIPDINTISRAVLEIEALVNSKRTANKEGAGK